MKSQIPFNEALAKATELLALLSPHCSRIEIAGSIRRQKDYIGDIELVALPSNRNQLAYTLMDIANVGVKRDARMVKFNYRNIAVDLFLPQPHDYGRQLAIRTGSAEYAHRVLAGTWVRLGCKGTDEGLKDREGKVLTFETEEAFFSFLGLKWVNPKERSL